MIYKVKDGFVLRKVGLQVMAVPVGRRTSEIHGMVALTESGALLWDLLACGAKKESLVNALLDEYEIDGATASSDVDAFLSGLREQGVLEE